MRNRLGTILGTAVAVLIYAASSQAGGGETLNGMSKVIDGDTISIKGRVLRLHGIDAPELGQFCTIKGRVYNCGEISRSALMDLTAGTPVTCRLLEQAKVSDAEPQGEVALCTAGGYDLSEGMAYTGWALADRKITARYFRFETGAHEKQRGLWKGVFVTPWDWRGGKRLD